MEMVAAMPSKYQSTPSIHGYSEVLFGTNTTATENSQLLLDSVVDHDSAAFYLYYFLGKTKELAAVSSIFQFSAETEVVNTLIVVSFDFWKWSFYSLLPMQQDWESLAFGTSNQQIPNGAQQDYRRSCSCGPKKARTYCNRYKC